MYKVISVDHKQNRDLMSAVFAAILIRASNVENQAVIAITSSNGNRDLISAALIASIPVFAPIDGPRHKLNPESSAPLSRYARNVRVYVFGTEWHHHTTTSGDNP
jgi:hypothetical protein